MIWWVYHLEREYAHSLGDPRVCVVTANTKEEAERAAAERYYFPTGPLAIPAKEVV